MSMSSWERRPDRGAIPAKSTPLADYGSGVLFLILATVLCFAMFPFFDLSNLIMVYLLAVLVTATGCGSGPAVLNSLLSVLAFDFCFVPPRYSFTVDDAQYIVTFAVMFLVALVISHLAARLRQEAETARLQERQAEAMHGLSRQLAGTRGTESILKTAEQYLSEIFNCRVVALLPDETGKLAVAAGDPASVIQNDMIKEVHLAQSVYTTGRMAGWGIAALTAGRHPVCTAAGRPRLSRRFSPAAEGYAEIPGTPAAEPSGIALQANCPCPGSGTFVREMCGTVGHGIRASRG